MSHSRSAAGIGLVLLGVVLLLDALALLDLWTAAGGWWPLLLFVLGIVLFLRRPSTPAPKEASSAWGVLSTRCATAPERAYPGGRLVAVLGHAELDLRRATLDPGGADLAVRALLGNVAITVPPGWKVHVQPARLFASLDADVLPSPDDAPVLSIEGVAAFSDLHVRTASLLG